jgi:hypothetical protein
LRHVPWVSVELYKHRNINLICFNCEKILQTLECFYCMSLADIQIFVLAAIFTVTLFRIVYKRSFGRWSQFFLLLPLWIVVYEYLTKGVSTIIITVTSGLWIKVNVDAAVVGPPADHRRTETPSNANAASAQNAVLPADPPLPVPRQSVAQPSEAQANTSAAPITPTPAAGPPAAVKTPPTIFRPDLQGDVQPPRRS